MGEIAILHGRIIMNDKESGNEFFRNYNDRNHPLLPKESFNLNLLNSEHYRYNPILTFGRTYKYLTGGNEWRQLILKFEHILMNLNFDNAKLYLETEYMGNYEFLWKSTQVNNGKDLSFYPGRHSMFGSKLEQSDPLLPNDTEYPIQFNQEILNRFNAIIPELNEYPINSKIIITKPYGHKLWGHDAVRVILTKLQLDKIVEWGYENAENETQMYIVRNKLINQMKNAM